MVRDWSRRRVLAALGATALAGCGRQPASPGTGAGDGAGSDDIPYDTAVGHDETTWDAYDTDWTAPTDPPSVEGVEPTVLVENLEIPWDIAFAPNGEVFLSERTGSIVRFEAFAGGAGETVAEPDAVIDAGSVEPGADEGSWWVPGGEGGLLGLAVHPTYPDPPLVYAYFTTDTDDGRRNTVHAFDVSADDPGSAHWPVVEGMPANQFHNGGRIEFGPANYLWVTTGDAGEKPLAQDTGSLAGKVLRLNPDGSAPEANPDLGDGADPRVYTYGHRNPQGISWLPDATPVVTEHGPSGGDEVSVLRPGANHGWPEVRGPDYAGTDFQPPVASAPSWAPSGSVFYTGDAVSNWGNRLLFGGLIGQELVAATIAPADQGMPQAGEGTAHDADWYDSEYAATTHEFFTDTLGRVRHVEQGPDGSLYAITSNRDGRAKQPFPRERDDVLVRLGPES